MAEKLTVLIPCKDEQHNIRDCIEAARGIADEILIADSGSTDATLDVARDAGGCRIIEREFVDYADFKNWAIPQASHDWVLIVDADERVTADLAAEISSLLNNPPHEIDAYWVYRRTFFLGRELKHSGVQRDKACRLIRRDRCRYRPCRVHEEIDHARLVTGKLSARLLHYTVWNYDGYFEKQVRYTRWRALDRWEEGKRTNAFKLLALPLLRFLQLYIQRQGFRDGVVGLQFCMLKAFFVSFVKQARLWELEHGPARESAESADPADPAASCDASPRAA